MCTRTAGARPAGTFLGGGGAEGQLRVASMRHSEGDPFVQFSLVLHSKKTKNKKQQPVCHVNYMQVKVFIL